MIELLEYGPAPIMIIGIMFSLMIGMLVLLISMHSELGRVKGDYDALLNYLGDDRARNLMRELATTIRKIESDNRATDKDIAQLYSLLEGCTQKVAVVRYNAFHDVGSDQSYSVALLDSADNGVVISGIFGRDSSTSYAKPVISGFSDYVLTEEEEGAIWLARRRYIDKSYYR
jgi:hypothetical protein